MKYHESAVLDARQPGLMLATCPEVCSVAQAIVYCDRCGKLVPPGDVSRGSGIFTANTSICNACAEMLTPEQRAILSGRRPPQPDPKPATKKVARPPSRKGSGVRPAAGASQARRPSGSRSTMRRRRADTVREGEGQSQSKSSQTLLIVGIAVGVLAGLAVTLVLVGRGGDEPRELPPSENPTAVVGSRDPVPNASKKPDTGRATTNRLKPLVSNPSAARRLSTIRAMRGPSLERYAEMCKALESFAREFADTTQAAEAADLRAEIDKEYAEMAGIALVVAIEDSRYLASKGRYADAEKSLSAVSERWNAEPWLSKHGTPALDEALARVKGLGKAIVSGTLANVLERLQADDIRGAKAALLYTDRWSEADRAQAKGLRDKLAGQSEDGDGYETGLLGEYFEQHDRNPDKRRLRRVDANVAFQWGRGSPGNGLRGDNFSARWTGEIMAPAPGLYTFSIRYDDGAILDIDGKNIARAWGQEIGILTGEVELTAGWHEIQLEFKEHGGDAYCHLDWGGPGFDSCPVPSAVLRTKSD
jgi:hypothetical protein